MGGKSKISTWFEDDGATSAERHWRQAFIASVACGLVIKLLLIFAADVRNCLKFCAKLRKAGVRQQFLGGCLLLMRQTYAKAGQEKVMKIALILKRQGQEWSADSLRTVRDSWTEIGNKFGKKHMKKVQSRSAAYTGPEWIDAILQTGMKVFHKASRLLGACMESEEALPLCKAADIMAKGTYKIPLMSRYGPVHCYRIAMVFRTQICKLQPLKFGAEDWLYSRNMCDESTAAGFDRLGVHTLQEAEAMKYTVVRYMADSASSYTTVAQYNAMQLVELSCPVCEWEMMLKAHFSTAKWLLLRLPVDVSAQKQSRKRLVGMVEADKDSATGLDAGKASKVAKLWLAESPQQVKRNCYDYCPENLPRIFCSRCAKLLAASQLMPRGGGPPPKYCSDCYSELR